MLQEVLNLPLHEQLLSSDRLLFVELVDQGQQGKSWGATPTSGAIPVLGKKVQNHEKSVQCRTPPPEGFAKISIDASYSESDGEGGWEAICRNRTPGICFAAAGNAAMIT